MLFGQLITQDAQLEETFVSTTGCDSTHSVTVNFSVLITTSEVQNLCEGESVEIFGQLITQDAQLEETFVSAAGCGSTHSVTILFEEEIIFQETVEICPGEFIIYFGDTINQAGFYEYLLNPLSQGCDNIQELFVQMHEVPSLLTSVVAPCADENNGQLIISNSVEFEIFSLNGIDFQSEPIFSQLSSGE